MFPGLPERFQQIGDVCRGTAFTSDVYDHPITLVQRARVITNRVCDPVPNDSVGCIGYDASVWVG